MAQDQIPEIVRMKALRGFRGIVNGKFTVVETGQVVEVARELAVELRSYNKAVMTTEPLTDLTKAAKVATKEKTGEKTAEK